MIVSWRISRLGGGWRGLEGALAAPAFLYYLFTYAALLEDPAFSSGMSPASILPEFGPAGVQDLHVSDRADADELFRRGNTSSSSTSLYPLPLGKGFGSVADLARVRLDDDVGLVSGIAMSLNGLHEARVRRPLLDGVAREPDAAWTSLRVSALDRVTSQVRMLGDAPATLPGSEAVKQMLSSSSCVRLDRSDTVRPFVLEHVHVLQSPVGSVTLRPLLSDDASAFLDDAVGTMMKSDEQLVSTGADELRFAKPYSDPRLRRGEPDLDRLARRLHAAGLVTYAKARRGTVGVFTVGKKDKTLRLVFDCRYVNCLFREPPWTPLTTPASLSDLRLHGHPGSSGTEQPLSCSSAEGAYEGGFGALDLVDGFYQFQVDNLCSFFSLDTELDAWENGIYSFYDDATGETSPTEEGDLVVPCLSTLPMGWSWAVFFCQDVLLQRCRRADALFLGLSGIPSCPRIVVDRSRVSPLAKGKVWWLPYVDNGNVWAWDQEDAKEALRCLALAFDEVGLRYKVECAACSRGECIGYDFDTAGRAVRNKASRIWRLHQGARALALQGHCTPKVMQVACGLLTHALGLRRCALSILESSYAFAGEANDVPLDFGLEVRDELLTAAYVLLVVECQLGRPPCRTVYLTDASLEGFALVETIADATEVESAVQVRERWRFRHHKVWTTGEVRAVPHSQVPERAAIGSFEAWADAEEVPEDVALLRASRRRALAAVPLEVNASQPPELDDLLGFEPLPPSLLRAGRWTSVVAGAWKRFNRIHEREARASLLGLRRSAHTRSHHGSLVLSIGDNLSEICCMEKGRAKNRSLNQQARRAASLQIGAGIDWRRRHCCSDENHADDGSRLADAGAIPPGAMVYGPAVDLLLASRARGVSDTNLPAGSFILEIGSVPAVVSSCGRWAGWQSFPPLRYRASGSFDTRRRWLQDALVRWIRQGRVTLLVLQLPASGSAAYDDAVEERQVMRLVCRLVRAANESAVPFVLHGPRYSAGWRSPELRACFPKKTGVVWKGLSAEDFGAPYLRPMLVVGTLPGLDLLSPPAVRHAGRCRRQLVGKAYIDGAWQWRSRIADEVPLALAARIVALLDRDAGRRSRGRVGFPPAEGDFDRAFRASARTQLEPCPSFSPCEFLGEPWRRCPGLDTPAAGSEARQRRQRIAPPPGLSRGQGEGHAHHGQACSLPPPGLGHHDALPNAAFAPPKGSNGTLPRSLREGGTGLRLPDRPHCSVSDAGRRQSSCQALGREVPCGSFTPPGGNGVLRGEVRVGHNQRSLAASNGGEAWSPCDDTRHVQGPRFLRAGHHGCCSAPSDGKLGGPLVHLDGVLDGADLRCLRPSFGLLASGSGRRAHRGKTGWYFSASGADHALPEHGTSRVKDGAAGRHRGSWDAKQPRQNCRASHCIGTSSKAFEQARAGAHLEAGSKIDESGVCPAESLPDDTASAPAWRCVTRQLPTRRSGRSPAHRALGSPVLGVEVPKARQVLAGSRSSSRTATHKSLDDVASHARFFDPCSSQAKFEVRKPSLPVSPGDKGVDLYGVVLSLADLIDPPPATLKSGALSGKWEMAAKKGVIAAARAASNNLFWPVVAPVTVASSGCGSVLDKKRSSLHRARPRKGLGIPTSLEFCQSREAEGLRAITQSSIYPLCRLSAVGGWRVRREL